MYGGSLAQFCFSLDLELEFYGKRDNSVLSFEKEKKAISKILQTAKKYEVPITFAIVGKLMAKAQEDEDSLIQEILGQRQNHEIACHSFSHKVFSEIREKEAEKEIKKSVAAAKKFGTDLKTFIFPRNTPGHLQLLKKFGFTHYVSQQFKKNSVFNLLTCNYQVLFPRKIKKLDLVEVPRTLKVGSEGFFNELKYGVKANSSALSALKNDSLFHLWGHVFELTPKKLKIIEKVFGKVKRMGFKTIQIQKIEAKKVR